MIILLSSTVKSLCSGHRPTVASLYRRPLSRLSGPIHPLQRIRMIRNASLDSNCQVRTYLTRPQARKNPGATRSVWLLLCGPSPTPPSFYWGGFGSMMIYSHLPPPESISLVRRRSPVCRYRFFIKSRVRRYQLYGGFMSGRLSFSPSIALAFHSPCSLRRR